MYINVGTNSRISIIARRKPGSISRYLLNFVYYVLTTEKIEIMNRNEPSTKEFGDSTMYHPLIIPLVHGSFSVINYRYDSNTYLLLHRNNEPNKKRLNSFSYYTFNVFCYHGEKVLAQIGDKSYIVPIENDYSVEFKMIESGYVTFIPICHDNTEKYCQITYETPENTGYHLIRYPSRDGISTTGSGFYAEIIPVVKGKNFTYYQTYSGAIEKVREYSEEPIKVEMKVDDLKNYKNFKKARRFCLLDLFYIINYSKI